MNEEDYWGMRATDEQFKYHQVMDDWNAELTRPSVIFKPKIYLDGDMWCALYGENIQEGVAGFGESPDKAVRDFDRSWHKDTDLNKRTQDNEGTYKKEYKKENPDSEGE